MPSDNGSILITGASKGIGRATAAYLDAHGYTVFGGVRSESDAAALRSAGSERLVPLFLDVTDRALIGRAVESVRRQTDGLAGVVNNAGIVVAGPLEFLPPEHVRQQFEVNVLGVLQVTQAFMPLIRQGRGRIINISSLNGRIASPFGGPYAASKFALEALSDALRMELRRWRIPVVVIQPGAIDTPIWETAAARAIQLAKELPEEGRHRYGRVMSVLAERAGRPPAHAIAPERVARVVARALRARRPKTRYLVGRDAWLAAMVSAVVPDRMLDWMLTK